MLRRAISRSGIDGRAVSFHTLRHSFATRLVAANVDIKTVSTILGHSTSRMLLERYAHESNSRGKQAAPTFAAVPLRWATSASSTRELAGLANRSSLNITRAKIRLRSAFALCASA
jgi:hypothetical protein